MGIIRIRLLLLALGLAGLVGAGLALQADAGPGPNFTATFSATIDEASPANPSIAPVDDNCPVGGPCKMRSRHEIARTSGTGEGPLARIEFVVPNPDGVPGGNGFDITSGLPVPNGVDVVEATFSVNLQLAPDPAPCNVPAGPVTFTLFDGALPAFYGEGPNGGTGADLINPAVWPTRLEAAPGFLAYNSGAPSYTGAAVRARYTALIPILNAPANIVVFDTGAGGYVHVLILGDPSVPVNPLAPRPCAPFLFDATYYGETDASDTMPGRLLRSCLQEADPTFQGRFIDWTDSSPDTVINDTSVCGSTDPTVTPTPAPQPTPGPVGGISFDPVAARAPAQASAPSTDALRVELLIGALAGLVAFGSAGWYAWRRRPQ